MKVAALPSTRFSRASPVLRPPPTPCLASLPRFRVSPLCTSLPVGVASAGPNRVSPVNLMCFLCVPPPIHRPGDPDLLSLYSGPWQASPQRHRLAPGIDPVESAYSLVGFTMLKQRSLVLRPADSPCPPADT